MTFSGKRETADMPASKMQMSPYGEASLTPSPVNRMMASFAADFRDGVDINLGVGYVNEDTIPRRNILEGLNKVLAEPAKYRVPFNYGGPEGSDNLVASIRNYYSTHQVGGLSAADLADRRIIIGGSGATSLLDGLANIMQRGLVITSDPLYYIYSNALERMGFEILAIPEDDDGMDPEKLQASLAELGERRNEISFIYIVTINNPTSVILSNERRRMLVEAAARLSRELHREIPIIFDKAYEDLIHDTAVPPVRSGMLHDREGLAYEIGTLSKVLAPAMRIGYLIGPNGPLMDAMVQRTSDLGFSAPLILQEIASYMLDYHLDKQLERVKLGYRKKARAVRGWIDEYLGDEVEHLTGGQAGFYFYITFRDTETTEDSRFFTFLSRSTGDAEIDGSPEHPRVIYIPGEFCVHSQGNMVAQGRRQLRLSYGFEELDQIEKAIRFMAEAARYARSVRQADDDVLGDAA